MTTMLFCRKSFAKPVATYGSNFLSVPKLRLFSVGNSRLTHSTLLLTYVLLSKLRNVTMPQFPSPLMGSFTSAQVVRLSSPVLAKRFPLLGCAEYRCSVPWEFHNVGCCRDLVLSVYWKWTAPDPWTCAICKINVRINKQHFCHLSLSNRGVGRFPRPQPNSFS